MLIPRTLRLRRSLHAQRGTLIWNTDLPADLAEYAPREVNRKFFEVELPPGTGQTLEIETKRFANKPSYAFPWHGDKIPVQ
ncbi:MAG TPA: hypothetical protein VML01_01000 [Bryobacterales bacterium]|nr:hypothetical protein [Bryobacterales bacterium]